MVPAGVSGALPWPWLKPEAGDAERLLQHKQRTILHQIKVIKLRLLRAEPQTHHNNHTAAAGSNGCGTPAAAAQLPEPLPLLRGCEPAHAVDTACHIPSSQPHMDGDGDGSPMRCPPTHHHAAPARCSSPCSPSAPPAQHRSPQPHATTQQQQQQGSESPSRGASLRHASRGNSVPPAASAASAGPAHGPGRSSHEQIQEQFSTRQHSSCREPGSSSGKVSGTPSGSRQLPDHQPLPPSNLPPLPAPPPLPRPPVPPPRPAGQTTLTAQRPADAPIASSSQPPPHPSGPCAQEQRSGEAGDSLPSVCSPQDLPQPQPLLLPSASASTGVVPTSNPSPPPAEPERERGAAKQQPHPQPHPHEHAPSGSESGAWPKAPSAHVPALIPAPLTDSCEAAAAAAAAAAAGGSGSPLPSEGVVAGTPLRAARHPDQDPDSDAALLLVPGSAGPGEGGAGCTPAVRVEAAAQQPRVVAGTPPQLAPMQATGAEACETPQHAAPGPGAGPGAGAGPSGALPRVCAGAAGADCQEPQGRHQQLTGEGGHAGLDTYLQQQQAVHGSMHGGVHGGVHGGSPELVPATPISPLCPLAAAFDERGVARRGTLLERDDDVFGLCPSPSVRLVFDEPWPGTSPRPPPLAALSAPHFLPPAAADPPRWTETAPAGQHPQSAPTSTPTLLQQEVQQRPPWELQLPGHVCAAWVCSSLCHEHQPSPAAGLGSGSDPGPGPGPGSPATSCLLLQLDNLPAAGVSGSSSSSSPHRLLLLSSGVSDPSCAPPSSASPHILAELGLRLEPGVRALVARGCMELQASLSVHHVCCSRGRGCEHGGEEAGAGQGGSAGDTVLLLAGGVWQSDSSSSSGRHGSGGRAEEALAGGGGVQPLVPQARSIFALAKRWRSGGAGRGRAAGPPPSSGGSSRGGGVELRVWCRRSRAWSPGQWLQAPLTALSVLLVQLQGAGAVVAAGKGGQAHVWSWAEAAAHGRCGCEWLASRPPTSSFHLPAATYRGLAVSEVVELRLAGGGGGGSPAAAAARCLVLGCCSEGTVVVWDLLRRQLLSAVHVPMCRLCSLQPLDLGLERAGLQALVHSDDWQVRCQGGGGEERDGRGGEGPTRMDGGEKAGSGLVTEWQEQQEQEQGLWPILFLAKTASPTLSCLGVGGGVEAGQGQALHPGDSSSISSGTAGPVVLVLLWEDQVHMCAGPDLAHLPLPSRRGCDEQQQQQGQQGHRQPVGDDGAGPGPVVLDEPQAQAQAQAQDHDTAVCMAAAGGGRVVIGTAAGRLLVWDVVTGGLSASLDCSAARAPISCVALGPGPGLGPGLVRRASVRGGGGGAEGAEAAQHQSLEEEAAGAARSCRGAGGAEQQLLVVAGVGEVAVVWALEVQEPAIAIPT